MSDDAKTDDPGTAAVKRICAQLGEHFEHVQIFVVRRNDNGGDSERFAWGGGNWFARYGAVREWIVCEEERMRICVRRQNAASEDGA